MLQFEPSHDRIHSNKSHGNGEGKMNIYLSKQILDTLNTASEKFHEVKNTKKIMKQQEIVENFARKLKNKKTHDLEKVGFSIISDISKGNGDLEELRFRQMIIDKALKLRREDKKYTAKIERNFGEAPIFSAKNRSKTTVIKLKEKIGQTELIVGFRTIELDSPYGALQPFDLYIFMGLQKLWEANQGKMEFEFEYGDLVTLIGAEKEGGNYSLITDSLLKLSTTSIIMHDYRDESLKKISKTRVRNIIQDADIDKENNRAYVKFNEYVHHGLQQGNVIPISLVTYQDLNHKASKILYPLISSLILKTNEISIEKLIVSLGLSDDRRNVALSKIRKAFDELKENEVFRDYEIIRIGKKAEFVRVFPYEELILTD